MKGGKSGGNGDNGLPRNPYNQEAKQQNYKSNDSNNVLTKIHNPNLPIINTMCGVKIVSIVDVFETYTKIQGFGDLSRCLSAGLYHDTIEPIYTASKNDADDIYKDRIKFEQKMYREEKKKNVDNKRSYWGLIMQQLILDVETKVYTQKGYREAYEAYDIISLMKIIKMVLIEANSGNVRSDLTRQKRLYRNMAQGGSESITSFKTRSTNQLEVFKHLGYILKAIMIS
jgi:hypothetical protein